jgi:hypothetical protein
MGNVKSVEEVRLLRIETRYLASHGKRFIGKAYVRPDKNIPRDRPG